MEKLIESLHLKVSQRLAELGKKGITPNCILLSKEAVDALKCMSPELIRDSTKYRGLTFHINPYFDGDRFRLFHSVTKFIDLADREIVVYDAGEMYTVLDGKPYRVGSERFDIREKLFKLRTYTKNQVFDLPETMEFYKLRRPFSREEIASVRFKEVAQPVREVNPSGAKRLKVTDDALYFDEHVVEPLNAETGYRLGVLAQQASDNKLGYFWLPSGLDVRVFRKKYHPEAKAYVGTPTEISDYAPAFLKIEMKDKALVVETDTLGNFKINGFTVTYQTISIRYAMAALAMEAAGRPFELPKEYKVVETPSNSFGTVAKICYAENKKVRVSARIPQEYTDFTACGFSSLSEMILAGLKAVSGGKV